MIKKIITLGVILFTSVCAKPVALNKPVHKDKLAHTLIHQIQSKKNVRRTGDIIFRGKEAKGLIKTAKGFLGTRYRYGAAGRKSTDCSGFTLQVFKKHHVHLPRTSRMQFSTGKHVAKKNLRPGDLVFFSSKHTKNVAHVGIYIGHNKFIHASSGAHKVTITRLDKAYYRKHFKGARRV